MVLLVDDVLVFVMGQLQNLALKELYDVGKINDGIKENQLLYELGEITKDEWEEKNDALIEKLETAIKVRMETSPNVEVRTR